MRKFLLLIFISIVAICNAEGIGDNFICKGFAVSLKSHVYCNYIDVTLSKDDTPGSKYCLSIASPGMEIRLYPDSSDDPEASITNLYSVLYSLHHDKKILSRGITAQSLMNKEKVRFNGDAFYNDGKKLTDDEVFFAASWHFAEDNSVIGLVIEIVIGDYSIFFYEIPVPEYINGVRELFTTAAKNKAISNYIDLDGTVYQDGEVSYEKKWNPKTNSFGK